MRASYQSHVRFSAATTSTANSAKARLAAYGQDTDDRTLVPCRKSDHSTGNSPLQSVFVRNACAKAGGVQKGMARTGSLRSRAKEKRCAAAAKESTGKAARSEER